MKVQCNFTIDADVALELQKIKNKSALINSYLRSYFGIPSNLELEDAKQKAEEAKEIAAVLEAKVEEIETKQEEESKEIVLER